MRHAALYLRISPDRSGRADKIEDQEKWGREYAAATWPGMPVVVYSDDQKSGHKQGVIRPGFDRLCEAIEAGQVAELWAKEQSRLTRQTGGNASWFEFAAFASRHG